MSDVAISREQIDRAFAALAERLARVSLVATVHAFGDAAMLLRFDGRDGVRSVQGIVQPRAAVLAEAAQAGPVAGLPANWLNDRGRGSVPASFEFGAVEVWEHPSLRVLVLGAEELLAMKVLAPIDDGAVHDLRVLAGSLGISSMAEIDVLLADVMPGQTLGKLARQTIDEILSA
jgi:hypothetical protein